MEDLELVGQLNEVGLRVFDGKLELKEHLEEGHPECIGILSL